MSFGLGRESTTTDSKISLPTISEFSYSSSTDTYTMKVAAATRSDGTTLQEIETRWFECSRARVQTNVNMQNYTKFFTYGAGQLGNGTVIAKVDPRASGAPYGYCVIKGSVLDSFLFNMGTYVIRPHTVDHENIGTVTGSVHSPHMVRTQYNAPPSVNATVSTTTKKVTVTWTKPTTLTNGNAIDNSNFKGYLVYFKNRTTGKLAYAFGTTSGYDTVRYVTPIGLAKATYEVSVCGWSFQNDEGKCRARTQSVIVP